MNNYKANLVEFSNRVHIVIVSFLPKSLSATSDILGTLDYTILCIGDVFYG